MTVVLIVYVDVSALILSVYLVFQFFLYYKKNYDKQIQLVKLFGRHGIGLKVVCSSLSTGHKIDILLAAWSLEWWFIRNLVYCLQRSCQPLSSLASILESFLKTLVYLLMVSQPQFLETCCALCNCCMLWYVHTSTTTHVFLLPWS